MHNETVSSRIRGTKEEGGRVKVSDILRPKLLLFLIRHVRFYRQRSRPCRAQRRRRHRPESLGGVFVRRTGIAVLAIAVFESDSALVEAEEGSRTASK